jgi:hypothetical protein
MALLNAPNRRDSEAIPRRTAVRASAVRPQHGLRVLSRPHADNALTSGFIDVPTQLTGTNAQHDVCDGSGAPNDRPNTSRTAYRCRIGSTKFRTWRLHTSEPPQGRRSCPAPAGVGRFVIRATRERGVGVPSSLSVATASREAPSSLVVASFRFGGLCGNESGSIPVSRTSIIGAQI